MDTSTTRTVTELQERQRAALEQLLGQPLNEAQQVFILAFTPDSAVDSAGREAARQHLLDIFAKTSAIAAERNISAVDADALVAEAMQHVRGRN